MVSISSSGNSGVRPYTTGSGSRVMNLPCKPATISPKSASPHSLLKRATPSPTSGAATEHSATSLSKIQTAKFTPSPIPSPKFKPPRPTQISPSTTPTGSTILFLHAPSTKPSPSRASHTSPTSTPSFPLPQNHFVPAPFLSSPIGMPNLTLLQSNNSSSETSPKPEPSQIGDRLITSLPQPPAITSLYKTSKISLLKQHQPGTPFSNYPACSPFKNQNSFPSSQKPPFTVLLSSSLSLSCDLPTISAFLNTIYASLKKNLPLNRILMLREPFDHHVI